MAPPIKTPYYLEGLPVILKRHPRSKSLRLRLDPLKKIPILTAPPYCKPRDIESFLVSATSWWRTQMIKTSPLSHVDSSLPTHIPFLGTAYQLIQRPALKKIEIVHDTREIIIGKNHRDIKKLIKNHMTEEALSYFKEASETYAQHLNVRYEGIALKDYRSRWGGCHSDKRLTYSWRLIMAPLEVLHYVCAHEVSHLLHFNHSPAFWNTVASLMPAYQKPRTWLKKNGRTLFEAF